MARMLLHLEVLKAAWAARPRSKREMNDRRQDDDWIWLVAEVIGVLLLFGLMWSESRQMIFAAGVPAVCAISIAGTGLIGFGIYRFVTRSQ